MYRTINVSIYRDAEFRKLTERSQHLFLYLITNSLTHFCGIYYIPFIMMSHETHIPIEYIPDLIIELRESKFLLYDNDNEIIFILNMLKHQAREGGQPAALRRSVETKLLELKDSWLVAKFIERYQDLINSWPSEVSHRSSKKYLEKQPLNNPCSTVEQPLNNPLTTDTDTDTAPDLKKDLSLVSSSLKDKKVCIENVESQNLVLSEPKIEKLKVWGSDPLDLVDLWNERRPESIQALNPRFVKEQRLKQINKALKDFPNKEDWEQIFDEYHHSKFLRGEEGAEGHGVKNFDWLLQRGKADLVENYLKVQNGKYRDREVSHMFTKKTQESVLGVQSWAQKRIRAAEFSLNGNEPKKLPAMSIINLTQGATQ